MPTILLIDDDDQLRMLFQVALAGTGYRVLIVENGKHGLRLLEHQEVWPLPICSCRTWTAWKSELLHLSRPAGKIIAMSGGSTEHDYLDTANVRGRTTPSRSRSAC